MRISCPECEATYHFASSLIPPGGYDARCIHCQAAFFVKPHGNTNTEPTVAVPCPVCETRYCVSVDDIPPEGYDAQCHECRSVFFVDRASLDREPLEEEEAENAPEVLGLPKLGADFKESTLKVRLRDDERQAVGGESHESSERNVLGSVPVSDTEVCGVEQTANPQAGALTLKVSKAPRGVWRWIAIFGSLVAAWGIGAFLVAPLFEPKAKTPQLSERLRTGLADMLRDTEEGYDHAAEVFSEVLEYDPERVEARALYGLSLVMRGANLRERSDFAAKRRKEVQAVVGTSAVGDVTSAELDGLVIETRAFARRGYKLIDQGFAELRAALADGHDHPVVLEAAALYYSMSPDTLPRCRAMLMRALAARDVAIDGVDWRNPPSVLSALVMSRLYFGGVWGSDQSDQAVAILDSVLRRHPDAHRARFEVAQFELSRDRAREAMAAVAEVLARDEAHERAGLWRNHLQVR